MFHQPRESRSLRMREPKASVDRQYSARPISGVDQTACIAFCYLLSMASVPSRPSREHENLAPTTPPGGKSIHRSVAKVKVAVAFLLISAPLICFQDADGTLARAKSAYR